VTARGIGDVCYGNEPMRRKLLNKPHHVPSRAMEFLGQQPKRRPRTSLPAREVGQVSVELFRLLGDLRALLKPLGDPNPVKKAVRIDKFAYRST
jgi:hypothetical protein